MGYATYGELLKRKGDHLNARLKLFKAIDIFTECRANGWIDRYEKKLTALFEYY